MPFLMTYTIINYAYFTMAMTYDVKLKQTARVEGKLLNKRPGSAVEMNVYGSTSVTRGRKWEDNKEYEQLQDSDDEVTLYDSSNNNKTLEVNEPPDYETSQKESERAISDNDEEYNVESNVANPEDACKFPVGLFVVLFLQFILRFKYFEKSQNFLFSLFYQKLS